MKRSNPSSSKKTHIPSDFKRLKAKVGKRAPQKANVTDTKFKTTSIQVRSQNITVADSKADTIKGKADFNEKDLSNYDMVSSKGKQLYQLLSCVLNNISANARLSALQGIKDATKNVPSEVLCNYLSVLVPPLSKAMVDEDSKVRKMARSLFFQDFSVRIVNNDDSHKMRPFLPLVIAYIASALHSLDQDIRYDGCTALENLCFSFGHELNNNDSELQTLLKTIPAFAILLDDVGGGISSVSKRGIGSIDSFEPSKSTNGNKMNKNRKKKAKGDDKAIGVLKSFIAIMKVTTLSGHEEIDVDKTWLLNSDAMKRLSPNGSALLPSLRLPNLRYLPGGSSTNAIVLNFTDRSEENTVNKIHLKGIHGLSTMLKRQKANQSTLMTSKSLSIFTQIDMLSKLRNRFVEVTQNGYNQSGKGLSISSHYVQEIMLLVSALRVLWNCHPQVIVNDDVVKTDEWKKFTYLAKNILQLQMDVFPIQDTSGNVANKYDYDTLNSSICCSISEFGSILDPPDNDIQKDTILKTDWVDVIFSYLIPQLSHDDDALYNKTKSSNNSKITLMKVLEQLLFRRESGVYFLEDKNKRLELLSTFSKVFFLDSETPSVDLCCSIEGRRAVNISLSLIAEFFRLDVTYDFSVDGQLDNECWTILSQIALKLPQYLMMWRGNFVKDSSLVFSTLLSIVRQCKMPSASKFCNTLRSSVMDIFVTESKRNVSVFEELSSTTSQKLAVSLLGILSHPSKSLILSLGQICARHNAKKHQYLSGDTIDYIMNVIYSIKDTISTEIFCQFLVDSIGFSLMDLVKNDYETEKNRTGENDDNIMDVICSLDVAIARTCRYICLELHDNEIFFGFLNSTLMSWLINQADDSKLHHQIKARAAIIIISSCSLLIGDEDNHILSGEVLRETMLKVVCDFYMSSEDMFKHENHQMISPLIALFRQHPHFFCSVVSECGDRVAELGNEYENRSKAIISNLLYLLKNAFMITIIKQKKVSDTLISIAHSIEKATADGPLHIIGGTLLIQAQSILGFTKKDRSR